MKKRVTEVSKRAKWKEKKKRTRRWRLFCDGAAAVGFSSAGDLTRTIRGAWGHLQPLCDPLRLSGTKDRLESAPRGGTAVGTDDRARVEGAKKVIGTASSFDARSRPSGGGRGERERGTECFPFFFLNLSSRALSRARALAPGPAIQGLGPPPYVPEHRPTKQRRQSPSERPSEKTGAPRVTTIVCRRRSSKLAI